MIETIVMIGVVGNFLLQSVWFIWTLKNHSHKHIENNPDQTDQTEPEYPAPRPHNKRPIKPSYNPGKFVPMPGTPTTYADKPKKYNPDEIEGEFDSFFGLK
jgi:cell division protein FtsN